MKALGRRRWKKASGDHQHARVEHAFFRYTSIVGDCLRARSSSGQRREAVLACHVLNRMTELGRPVSYRIGRSRARRFEARRPARIRAPTPVASVLARASVFSGVARRPASHVRYDSGDAPSIAANAACDWPSAIRQSRSVRGSTTSHHAIGAGRCEARTWRWRTSVSQSLEPTGHFVRLHLRLWLRDRSQNRQIL